AAKETPNCAIAAQCGQDNLTPLKFKKEPFDTVAALVTLGSKQSSERFGRLSAATPKRTLVCGARWQLSGLS
ncbi:hypothetical protein, partial [uncultured Roseobacter sp.]|uniref:hypothetical protein n=1 Tax=uncultured Roseobacter sp. TaxID=114847 RepID=UPI002615A49A